MRNLQRYVRPETPEEAVELKRELGDKAVYLAGGSDLLVHRPSSVEVAIDIRHCGLGYVLESDDAFVIGGAALLRDAESAVVQLASGMLGAAFRETAPWLIRNAATVAGNIANASPAADSVPALLAADAELLLLSDTEELVPLGEILVGSHQTTLGNRLIKEIRIPRAVAQRRGVFHKVARSHSDIAQINLAVSFALDGGVLRDVRIALGAVGPTAVRARSAESAAEGVAAAELSVEVIAHLVQNDISPITDWRATADYRRHMCEVMTRRSLGSLLADIGHGEGQ